MVLRDYLDKMDEPQPGTPRYSGDSRMMTVSWHLLAQTAEMEGCICR